MSDIRWSVEAKVNPTEDEHKVERAIKNLFPNIQLSLVKDAEERTILKGHTQGLQGLSAFRELLKRERIRAAARSIMFSSVSDSGLVINLNKQAAFAGHVSFAIEPGESPLGPITVKLECSEPKSVIEWLAQTDHRARRS